MLLLALFTHLYTLTGLKHKPLALIKRVRKVKKEAPALEKPAVVKTHLRNMIVVPEMIGSMVGIHNGKTFNQVEIKVRPDQLESVYVHFQYTPHTHTHTHTHSRRWWATIWGSLRSPTSQ